MNPSLSNESNRIVVFNKESNTMNTEQDKRTLRLAKRIMNKSNNSSRSRISSSRNNNKKRKNYRHVNNTNTNEYNKQVVTVSVIGLPLTTLVSYLATRDVLNCIQTCKEWKKNIDQDGVWREVAKVVSPNGVKAMIQEEENNNNHGSMPAKFYFRNMAIALSRRASEYNPPVVDEFPQATLRLQDVLIVIEFRYRNKRVGALCSALTDLTEDKPGTRKSIKLDRSNDFNKGQLSSILLEDDWDIWDNDFEVTTRLVRRDTGKSFCIHDYQPIECYGTEPNGNNEDTELCMCPEDQPFLTPDAPNLSGIIARGLCHQHDYNSVNFNLEIRIDMIAGLEGKIRYCELNLSVHGGEENSGYPRNTVFNSMNHFLLFLEGFHWK